MHYCDALCYRHDGVSNALLWCLMLWARWRLKSPASRLFTQPFIYLFIQAQIKENIKAPRHWPLWGEFTGEFPSQRSSNAENIPIWGCHHYFLGPCHRNCPINHLLENYYNKAQHRKLKSRGVYTHQGGNLHNSFFYHCTQSWRLNYNSARYGRNRQLMICWLAISAIKTLLSVAKLQPLIILTIFL